MNGVMVAILSSVPILLFLAGLVASIVRTKQNAINKVNQSSTINATGNVGISNRDSLKNNLSGEVPLKCPNCGAPLIESIIAGVCKYCQWYV